MRCAAGDGCHLCEGAPSLKIRSFLKPGHDQVVPVMHLMSLAGMSCMQFLAILSAMVFSVMR